MINSLKTKLIVTVTLLFTLFFASAQEILQDKVADNTVKSQQGKKRVDGIVATVGDYVVLDSDIDKSLLEISSQGGSTKDITRCQMLGKLLEDKLYAHQAIQDSIVVKDEEIKEKMGQQIDYMVEQLGSVEKLVAYYKKSNEDDLKTDLFEILKIQKLASEMQRKIIDPITITPEETRVFFKNIPENERPIFGTELEVAQIVISPKVSEAEKQRAIEKLKQIKQEVTNGSSFKTRAVIYTDDKASASTGGFYKINKKTPFVKEFKDVAFSLQEGEISEPFETEFGYHIILLEKIRGQDRDVRHILIMPKVSDESLKEAKQKITDLRKKIENKEITFADAARAVSDEKETRANGGTLVNPKTQDTHFELTKMDPEMYSEVSSLKSGEISAVTMTNDPKAGKKFKIIMVTNKIEDHAADYSKDFTKIKDLALKEKQLKAIAKWSDEKIKDTYIKINAEYRDCAFTNNWLKKAL